MVNFKKTDIFIVGFILLTALALYALRAGENRDSGKVCSVFLDGEEIAQINLSEDREYQLPQIPDIGFTVSGGKIAVTYSDCPDKVCVNTGFIGGSGQKIVCLPNRVVVSVYSASKAVDEPDIIAE